MMPKQATVEVETREDRLVQVIRDLEQARADWDKMGRPMLTRGASLDVKPHPYVKIIRDLEHMAERMMRPVESAVGGRPAGSQSAPDRVQGEAPARLTAVA